MGQALNDNAVGRRSDKVAPDAGHISPSRGQTRRGQMSHSARARLVCTASFVVAQSDHTAFDSLAVHGGVSDSWLLYGRGRKIETYRQRQNGDWFFFLSMLMMENVLRFCMPP